MHRYTEAILKRAHSNRVRERQSNKPLFTEVISARNLGLISTEVETAMNRRDDPNPFDEEVNPFSNGDASKSRVPEKTFGFGQKHDATVDIPLDSMNDPKKKEKELLNWEAELKKREKDIKLREEVVAGAAVPTDDRNWPPFFPIIHHDIANEIPVHAQKLQYLAFASWLAVCLVFNIIAVIVCWIKGGGVKILFLAVLYGVVGLEYPFRMYYGTGHCIVQ